MLPSTRLWILCVPQVILQKGHFIFMAQCYYVFYIGSSKVPLQSLRTRQMPRPALPNTLPSVEKTPSSAKSRSSRLTCLRLTYSLLKNSIPPPVRFSFPHMGKYSLWSACLSSKRCAESGAARNTAEDWGERSDLSAHSAR